MDYLLITTLAVGALVFAMSRSLLATVLALAVTALLTYLITPTMSATFYGTVFLYLVIIFIFTLLGFGLRRTTADLINMGLVAALLCIGVITPFFVHTGSHVFKAEAYRSVLETPEEGVFETDVAQIDQSQVRTVDQSLATRRAEELLGAEAGLGSRAQVGRMSIQSIDGKLYWIGALEHSGFFKWLSNSTTPGYVKVSATSYRDAEIVLDHEFRYGTSGFFFSKDVTRRLWMNGYAPHGITDITLELDDDEKPWWVATLYHKTIFLSGAKPFGVVIMDPETGDPHVYDIDEAPAWIDRIQPEPMIQLQIDWWGSYVNGFWNALFAKRDVVAPTPGMSLVYSEDGRAMWYTGIRSAGQDQGTQGFMLIDSRTGKPTYYRKSGVTESGAKAAIEGKVSNYNGYYATNPILYNVNGEPVFIATIKDGSGNYKMVGAVSAQNRSVVVVGDSVRDAMRQFASAILSQGLAGSLDTGLLPDVYEGRVLAIGSEVTDGETRWYIRLANTPGVIFQAPAGLSDPVAPVTRIGDRVKITALDTGRSLLGVETLANLEIEALQRSTNEERVREDNSKVLDRELETRKRGSLEGRLKKMDPEEVDNLLETLGDRD